MWTLDELVERVGRSLAAAEYPGAPNNRVRDLPDRRAIRWYTTTGLVDRPLGMRGRTALYVPRHLLQLVAVKRRQAEGRTLAEIQVELSGVSDEALAAVARVPDELLVAENGPQPDPSDGVVRTRFWAVPAPAAVASATTTPAAGTPESRTRPVATTTARSAAPIGGVALGGGVILVTPGLPTDAQRAEIAAAARPLMELLTDRGLLNTEDGNPS